jgi:hypothetical protein
MNRSPGSVTCWADCARSVALGALLAVGHGPSHQRETKKIKRPWLMRCEELGAMGAWWSGA